MDVTFEPVNLDMMRKPVSKSLETLIIAQSYSNDNIKSEVEDKWDDSLSTTTQELKDTFQDSSSLVSAEEGVVVLDDKKADSSLSVENVAIKENTKQTNNNVGITSPASSSQVRMNPVQLDYVQYEDSKNKQTEGQNIVLLQSLGAQQIESVETENTKNGSLNPNSLAIHLDGNYDSHSNTNGSANPGYIIGNEPLSDVTTSFGDQNHSSLDFVNDMEDDVNSVHLEVYCQPMTQKGEALNMSNTTIDGYVQEQQPCLTDVPQLHPPENFEEQALDSGICIPQPIFVEGNDTDSTESIDEYVQEQQPIVQSLQADYQGQSDTRNSLSGYIYLESSPQVSTLPSYNRMGNEQTISNVSQYTPLNIDLGHNSKQVSENGTCIRSPLESQNSYIVIPEQEHHFSSPTDSSNVFEDTCDDVIHLNFNETDTIFSPEPHDDHLHQEQLETSDEVTIDYVHEDQVGIETASQPLNHSSHIPTVKLSSDHDLVSDLSIITQIHECTEHSALDRPIMTVVAADERDPNDSSVHFYFPKVNGSEAASYQPIHHDTYIDKVSNCELALPVEETQSSYVTIPDSLYNTNITHKAILAEISSSEPETSDQKLSVVSPQLCHQHSTESNDSGYV